MNEYKVGIYLRLSKDDSNTKESESIISQRSYIMNYLNENNYILCKEYVDDGISGTTFDRPGLEELLLDIKNKKINLVVTKDLSRLGRNNGKMSILLDEYFVKYNVRFIAINDNYDNFNNETTELVWLKNGINEMYALDISKKVKSSLKTRKKQGLYTGWKAPYGYKRSNKDYHKLIPDKNASLIVRKIFDLALKNNYSQIARILNNENIETPSSYANISYMHPEWSPTTIKEILTNQTYLGHTVQGKRKKISYKLKKETKVKEEDWIIVKNTHEAIIDTNLFNQAKEELIEDLPQEELLIIKDYIAPSRRLLPEKILQNIRLCSQNELIQSEIIARFLGYEQFDNYEEVAVYPRGYRILNKIPRMPNSIVTNLVKTFKSFQHILLADVDKLDEVEGIGEVRARTIKQSLRRMQEQFVFDNLMI